MSASLPSALKQDTPHTLPHAHTVIPMRLHRVRGASAPSNHEVHGQRHQPQLLLLAAALCHRRPLGSLLTDGDEYVVRTT